MVAIKKTMMLAALGLSIAANAQTNSSDDKTLSMRGLGAVRLGMTVQEASAAGHATLKRIDSVGGDRFITYLTEDARYLVGAKDGRLRVVCAASKRISTSHGIRIEDPAKKLGQFPRASLKASGNHYELQPKDPQDRGYIMWFEVHGGEITQICASTPAIHSYIMQGGV